MRYVVQTKLSGDAASINAYSVGVNALGRTSKFDPTTNASVRVSAQRLRAALARYYEQEGAKDLLTICVPTGGYIPVFQWQDTADAKATPAKTNTLSVIIQQHREHRNEVQHQIAAMHNAILELRTAMASWNELKSTTKVLVVRSRTMQRDID